MSAAQPVILPFEFTRRTFVTVASAAAAAAVVGLRLPKPALVVDEGPALPIEGTPWRDTCIVGNLYDEAPREQDDLFAACNDTWLRANQEVPAGFQKYGVREELGLKNRANALAAIADESTATPGVELLRALTHAVTDWGARNAAGGAPLAATVERILAIETMDDLTAYLTQPGFLASGRLYGEAFLRRAHDTSRAMLLLTPASVSVGIMSDPADLGTSMFAGLMPACGVPEEQVAALCVAASELATSIYDATEYPEGLGGSTAGNLEIWDAGVRTLEEIAELSPAYPLVEMLAATGRDAIDVSILSESWLVGMSELYVPENLEGFKGLLIEMAIFDIMEYLDKDSLSLSDTILASSGGAAPATDDDARAYAACKDLLPDVLGRVFVEACVEEGVREDVEQMCEEIRETFRARLEACAWLGDETRAKAVEKLSAMRVRAVCGDAWLDYGGLELPQQGSAPNGSAALGDIVLAIRAYNYQLALDRRVAGRGGDYWSDTASPLTEVGAFCDPQENSINIPAGILGAPFYHPGGELEERYFGLGMVVGHEITHGFDPQGRLFDTSGALADWWTEEDAAAFTELQQEVTDYFATIEIAPGAALDAQGCIGEIVGDMGGVRLMLDVMGLHDEVDYQRCFRAFAQVWGEVESYEAALELLEDDEHPPKYVRANATAQQFEEFHEAFGVTEGDGMWLAPERRVGIW